MKHNISILLASVISIWGLSTARAETPAQILNDYATSAKASGLGPFSIINGDKFFHSTHGSEWSCASCHSDNPMKMGKHAKTAKEIDPLAPAANQNRFTSSQKAEKWFKRNCNDVVGRLCTLQEKGDVLSYLLSLK